MALAIGVIGIVWALAAMKSSGGWSLVLAVMLSPVLLILLIADLIVKLAVTKRVAYIWLIETVFVVITVIVLKLFIFI
ncbi:hypothetical protein A4H97_18605 [Niastella yeongjuensis]|uniref:DUF1634 domain-containing protein n=2 Tax=Niastella yeongjuensis TaxID=354355 RepID=A0A1V9DY23_9BACT|nr:hypothetical protein A4H97_18605 [Niastella yeongjuensis]